MDRKLKMGVGLGGPSIIMIFVILCLTTLGALALMTSNADWKLTKKAADSITAYYEADSQAEEILAEKDSGLLAGSPSDKTTFTIPVSDTQSLLLQITQSGSHYIAVSRKLIISNEWDYDQFKIEFDDSITE